MQANTKFNLGDTIYWAEGSYSEFELVPCPHCGETYWPDPVSGDIKVASGEIVAVNISLRGGDAIALGQCGVLYEILAQEGWLFPVFVREEDAFSRPEDVPMVLSGVGGEA